MADARPVPPPSDPVLRARGLKSPKDGRIVTGRIREALRKASDRILEPGGDGHLSTPIAGKRRVGRVIRHEADPTLMPGIRAAPAANVAVHTAQPAVGDRPPVPLCARRNFLAGPLDASVERGSIERAALVPRNGIRWAMADLRPQVLLCDTEGAEAELMPPAPRDRLRAAIVEPHPQGIGRARARAVFAACHRAGPSCCPKASRGTDMTVRKGG
ncbi:FkbM family methyltransferase [Roseivivax sp. CAU 1761]